jgi:hypothetical protein
MVQKSVFVAVVTLACVTFVGGAQAREQKKPACHRTMEQCLQVCVQAGGQARYCPTYCENKQRDTGCP